MNESELPTVGEEVPLVRVENLKKHFPIRGGLRSRPIGWIYAVDGVSFTIGRGETLGLVGESGCGKSTVGRTVLQLTEATSGSVVVDGTDITRLSTRELRPFRRRMQIVFQDPYSSLNPRMTASEIVGEPLAIHGLAAGPERQEQVAALLDRVGLPRASLGKYPHEFSGGQRQRIGIARALSLSPDLIVCDEAVSALDVSIQAQVINLLVDLQQQFGLSYLFISHDLAVVEYVSHRVAVMYLGRIVELAGKEELFSRPLHPYTEALLSAAPDLDDVTHRKPRAVLSGEVPSPVSPPKGCHFHTRCPYAEERCRREEPSLRQIRPEHWVACHLREPENTTGQ